MVQQTEGSNPTADICLQLTRSSVEETETCLLSGCSGSVVEPADCHSHGRQFKPQHVCEHTSKEGFHLKPMEKIILPGHFFLKISLFFWGPFQNAGFVLTLSLLTLR